MARELNRLDQEFFFFPNESGVEKLGEAEWRDKSNSGILGPRPVSFPNGD